MPTRVLTADQYKEDPSPPPRSSSSSLDLLLLLAMKGKNGFVGFKNRMVLRPDKTGCLDLFHLLLTGDITASKSVECEKQEPVTILHRLIIFLSIVIQIVLVALTKPTKWVGTTVENWVNLFMLSDKSFFEIVSDLLEGKLVFPSKNFKSYRSILGWADYRVELAKNIRPEEGRYVPDLSIMASKFAYENSSFIENNIKEKWNMESVEVLNCSNDYHGHSVSSQAVIFSDKHSDQELVVVSFRGTQPFDTIQWCIDVDYSWYEHEEAGRIHEGFMRALGLQNDGEWPKEVEDSSQFAYYAVRERLRQKLKENPDAKIVVTGHSLGGAMAVLFTVVLMFHGEDLILEKLTAVYTFGQPRVGDEKLGKYVTGRLGGRYARFVYGNDIVPRLPFDDPVFEYKHFGTCCYFDKSYQGQIAREEPNKNYFTLTGILPKYLTAAYEFGRSFVIGFIEGPDYKEGWVMRLFRLVGLLIPGVSPHAPQDYVNSTRLRESPLPSDTTEKVK